MGSAYIFQRKAGTWQQVQKLQAIDKDTNDMFGNSVAISGDTAIIGACQKRDASGSYVGSAYIFQRKADQWQQVQKLQPSDKQANPRFGYSVVISGDTAIVGDHEGTNGSNAGNAYIFTYQNQNDSGIGQSFVGKIADVQIWNKARTPQEIKDSMYLQLTGQEIGLVGYWRLGAIVEGDTRQVLDFSVSENHGIVHGEAYVSDVTLQRDLQPGTPATKYENEELFAVSERATYEEEFEFKTNPSVKHNDVNGGKIFAIAYKGKKSRGSEDWIENFGNVTTEFSSLENNWYKAKSRFTVPDGVSVLRSFGITNVQGDWTSLDIRKHRIRLVSDSITEAKYSDSVTLETLAENHALLEGQLKNIELNEKQEEELIVQIIPINEQLKFLNLSHQEREAKINDISNQITSHEQDIEFLRTQHITLQRELKSADLQVTLYRDARFFIPLSNLGLGEYVALVRGNWALAAPAIASIGFLTNFNFDNDTVSSVRVPAGLQVTLYENANFTGRPLILKNDCDSLGGDNNFNDITSSVKVQTIGGYTNKWSIQTDLNNNNLLRVQKDASLTLLENERMRLNSENLNKSELEKKLKEVENKLCSIQNELNRLNYDFISGVKNTQQTPQTMPEVAKDSKGLVTQGALLGFVQPASRLNAIETCEGNVQLSYFDNQGRMRQTNFDATSDSHNATVEQWLPDAQRVCLNIAQSNHVVKLENPIYLRKEWTIEAWFSYPLPDKDYNTLTSNQDGSDRQIVVKDRKQLGTYYGSEFHDSGYNIKLLSNGWHHLTAVAKGDTTLFYIDGKKVGDVKQKAIEAETNADRKKELQTQTFKSSGIISTIGNVQANYQPFGKLAEVRLWGLALSEEEIAVNSKTLLSGNEPGLLAYYPMNEATGTTVRDSTGNERNQGTIVGASWWGCAAPIGNPGHQVMQFNGVDDYIELPSASIPTGDEITVSFWAKGGQSLPKDNSIIYAENASNQRILNIHLPWSDEGIIFDCGNSGNSYDRIKKIAAVTDYKGQWTHWAFTKNAQTREMKIYQNGILWGNQTDKRQDLKSASRCYLGKNSSNQYYDGAIAELCIWNVARTQEQIQANMHKPLTGKETNLVGYWPLNEIKPEGTVNKVLDLAGNNHGIVTGAIVTNDNALPLVSDAVVSTEYSTVTLDAVTKQKIAIMRRFFASPTSNGVNLLPDKRIETLELNWIGNAQFAPTLLGYIEGAPPIPSENLTVEHNYNGATSVEITMSEDVEFSWRRSQDAGLGATADTFVGAGVEISAGLGVETEIAKIRSGFKGNLDTSYQFQNESSIASGSSVSMTDKLELRGTLEQNAHFPHLGKRFIPKNVGYALVVSALADVFITRLARSKKMIGYQVQPVENIPPDVNTITFMINPAYVMKGSLDEMTGSRAASDRFFKHVPQMRSQYGSQYPASYYRLQEAYDLKKQIEQQDKQREAYFAQYNALLVDETSLDREVNSGAVPTGVSVNRPEDKPESISDEDWEKEQQKQQKEQIDRIEQQTKQDQDKQSEA